MADEYVPTTEQVRAVWAAWAEYGGLTNAPSGYTDDHLAEFDRYLSAHDRETAAHAWDEGAEAGRLNTYEHRPGRRIANPYREGDPT